MKKILTIISLFMMILTLSSCGVKKEIKEKSLPEGNVLDIEEINQYAEEIQEIYENEANNYDEVKTNWYSVSMDMVNENNIEEDDYTQKTKMLISMDCIIYSTPLKYEQKAKITINCEMEDTKKYNLEDKSDKNQTSTGKGKIRIILIDGKIYMDVDLKYKTDDEETKENKKYSYSLSSFDFESILEQLGITISGDFLLEDNDVEHALKQILSKSLKDANEDKESTTEILKTKKGFAISQICDTDEKTQKNNMIWEGDDEEYSTKKLYLYSKIVEENSKVTFSIQFNKVLFGVVIAPTETEKYEAK